MPPGGGYGRSAEHVTQLIDKHGKPLRSSVPVVAQRDRRATARWLRDAATGAIAARRVSLMDSRDDIARVWDRVAALAMDMIQNSARLKGAADQVIVDTVGSALQLNPVPDLSALGYTAEETRAFTRIVKHRWRRYAWEARECDARGKFTLPQNIDIALRHYMAFGEACGSLDWWNKRLRAKYGVKTGTKLCLISPHRLKRDTNEAEGLHSGVRHDENGRVVSYLCIDRVGGIDVDKEYPAFDRDRRPMFVHVFDPWDASDVRGISPFASAIRTYLSAETLDEVTLSTSILQQVFAAVLTSKEPTADAFQAIEELGGIGDEGEDLRDEFLSYLGARLDKARDSGLFIDGAPRVSHLAPGEDLQFRTASTPGSNYIPFAGDLRRGMARAIGVTYTSYSMDHNGATYSSVRMENASIWPLVLRRRERVAAPLNQSVYENWLDDEIGSGLIPLRGGYEAFRAHRDAIVWAEWQGPPKPSADDEKSAKAASERLQNGTTYLGYECAEFGLAVEDVIEQRKAELKMIEDAGLPNPFERVRGGGASPDPKEPPAVA